MDQSSVIVLILIAAWGGLEYRRRERKHKALLVSLEQAGWQLPPSSAATLSKLIGEVLVAVLLAASSGLMFYAGMAGTRTYSLLYFLGALLFAMMVIVVLMFLRDAGRRSAASTVSGTEEP